MIYQRSSKFILKTDKITPGWPQVGLGNLNVQLCQPLRNRTVTLYPDLGAFDKWAIKAKQLQAAIPCSVFMISDLLEQLATDEARNEGWDLGDGL